MVCDGDRRERMVYAMRVDQVSVQRASQFFIRHRRLLLFLLLITLLGVWRFVLAQGGAGDPFEEAGQQGCTVIRFIFRGTGAAILLGIVWAFALWTLFTQKGAIWGLGIAIVISLIIQFAPSFIGFFAPAVTSTCFA
jgi:hypothetical protein